MNNLILFLSHSIWIILALATIGYGLRDVIQELRGHFARQNNNPVQPVFMQKAPQSRQSLGRNFIFSH